MCWSSMCCSRIGVLATAAICRGGGEGRNKPSSFQFCSVHSDPRGNPGNASLGLVIWREDGRGHRSRYKALYMGGKTSGAFGEWHSGTHSLFTPLLGPSHLSLQSSAVKQLLTAFVLYFTRGYITKKKEEACGRGFVEWSSHLVGRPEGLLAIITSLHQQL